MERVAIVGDDLQYIETVTGRATYGTSALRGVIAGAGTGLLFGFIFGLLDWITPLVSAFLAFYGLLFGAIVGAVFGLIGHAVTGKHRGFDSLTRTVARRYDVIVDDDLAGRAAAILGERPWIRG